MWEGELVHSVLMPTAESFEKGQFMQTGNFTHLGLFFFIF